MTRKRVPETEVGIQGGLTVELYDQMQRRLRDKGWIETAEILKAGIIGGDSLEIGPGPGYLGLEWLKRTSGTTLKGLEISPDMIEVAQRNAEAYGLHDRVEYVQGNGAELPFEDSSFDGVFTAGSLHEWTEPGQTFTEIWRVLKVGGRFLVLDFRRDVAVVFRWFLWIVAKPKEMRPGLVTSINAAYTPSELRAILPNETRASCEVVGSPMGLRVSGLKRH